ncbi:peptidylprolyl isomerase [Thiohalorhabdus sp. Cl-TMA]|uniref:Peptidyl-prolyl cis-trans isomerase n=1 Tax=Thiohalorhabdus methylotrophus TaxID=3242694 RepID=A0ABV4TVG7_9GAMM
MTKKLGTGLLALAVMLAAPAGAAEKGPRVRLETTKGPVVLALYPERAPKTVDNFLGYVRDGFYDGTIFHRVVPGFVVQGGGFTKDLRHKPTREPIPNEADNGLTNEAGTISMARTSDPHSATSQFFLNLTDNPPLNHRAKTQRGWGYAVFGEVVAGMETVRAMGKVPTGPKGRFPRSVPRQPIVIEKATIVDGEAGAG